MKKFRCSSLHLLVGTPKTKGAVLTQKAVSYIRQVLREDVFGFRSFLGNKQTQKGVLLEQEAIRLSGQIRYRSYTKHDGRLENDFITGECDILDRERSLIIDTKCSWDIGTHPFFEEEALEKVKDSGYDWQMQGYMWLYDCEQAEIDFWLLPPCPPESLNDWDDIENLVNRVNAIDLRKRKTTVTIKRDEKMIERIQQQVQHAQELYQSLLEQLEKTA